MAAADYEAPFVRLGDSLTLTGDHYTASMLRKLNACVFEPLQLALFTQTVKPGMTVIDVGASIGLYTLLASRLVESDGRVIALEPDPRSYALLMANIARNRLMNVQALPCAIGGIVGRRTFYLGDQSTVSALYPESREHRIVRETEVTCRTLDGLVGPLGRVDVIKIDTEGAESEILSGMSRTLKMNRGTLQLFLEVHPEPLIAIGVYPVEVMRTLDSYFDRVEVIDESSGALRARTDDTLLARHTVYCS